MLSTSMKCFYDLVFFPPSIRVHIFCTIVGEVMRDCSTEFAADPCSLSKRGAMVRAARALLSAVTRLLILADMVDVHLLLKSLRMVCLHLSRYI